MIHVFVDTTIFTMSVCKSTYRSQFKEYLFRSTLSKNFTMPVRKPVYLSHSRSPFSNRHRRRTSRYPSTSQPTGRTPKGPIISVLIPSRCPSIGQPTCRSPEGASHVGTYTLTIPVRKPTYPSRSKKSLVAAVFTIIVLMPAYLSPFEGVSASDSRLQSTSRWLSADQPTRRIPARALFQTHDSKESHDGC